MGDGGSAPLPIQLRIPDLPQVVVLHHLAERPTRQAPGDGSKVLAKLLEQDKKLLLVLLGPPRRVPWGERGEKGLDGWMMSTLGGEGVRWVDDEYLGGVDSDEGKGG